MDLSKHSRQDLLDLRERVNRELSQRRTQDKQEARRELRQVAERYGFALGDLVTGTTTSPGRTGRIQYRHPEDPSKTWTGRGRKPNWLKEWEANGGSLDALRRH